ncbi:hypothetical protein ACRAWD_15355 [Caulobacter segnis]
MTLYLLALLIGVIAGLRAMTPSPRPPGARAWAGSLWRAIRWPGWAAGFPSSPSACWPGSNWSPTSTPRRPAARSTPQFITPRAYWAPSAARC